VNKKKLKVCVMIDILPNSGGGFHMAKSICQIIKNQDNRKIDFKFLTTYRQTKKILEDELNLKINLFNKNSIFNRFLSKIYKIKLFSNLIKFSPLEKYLKNNFFDLIYFISPSYLITQCKKIDSVYTIWETQFNDLQKLPEYQNNIINLRHDSFNFASKYSKKIFVGTGELANEVKKLYATKTNKLFYQPIPPYIISKKMKKNYKSKNNFINKIIKNKYYFYPAQYWKHKNHEYIIKAFKLLEKKKIDFKIVFSGYDKGYLSNLELLAKKMNCSNFFIFLNYVSDDDLIFLYKNCSALIIPSLVGTHTFPLYEGFYFKKPLIYNSKNLDQKFRENVISLNTDDLKSLGKCINYINKKNLKSMIESNFALYQKNFLDINSLVNYFLHFKKN